MVSLVPDSMSLALNISLPLRESFWMINKGSSVKSMWPHCSGVQLRCSWALRNRALTCAGDKGTQTAGCRANSSHAVFATQCGGIRASLQQQRAVTPAVALLVSSGVWHIATGSDRLPL
ncbi:hypothetical protein AVEN_41717-1 [Araneus ventricosus]|uniref:Uncharacterized protein n=1 Tax=Araneus ventricosus TaxID=182803 RepID=A0A4Y2AD73_ARAVE|nr:hypothetical protein AVEN_41717-1 [Araneus ventricosus]